MKTHTIQVCTGCTCAENLSMDIIQKAKEKIEKDNLSNIKIEKSGCLGMCAMGPNVLITNDKDDDMDLKNEVNSKNIGNIIDELNGN